MPPKKGTSRGVSSEPVYHGQLQAELDKFSAEFSQQIKDAISTAVDKALSVSILNLKKNFDSKVSELQDTVKAIQSDLQFSSETIVKLKHRISFLENSALQQRLWNNDREQRSRLRTFRLHNKKMDVNEAKTSVQSVYEFIVKPSFLKAKEEGDIDYTPKLEELCEFGHPLKTYKEGDIPAHIFRFTSRYFYSIFMRYSRDICADLNKSLPDSKKCRVGLDLSWLNRRCMSWLFKQNTVYRVRLSGSTLQFTLKSEPKKWLNVRNAEAMSIADLQVQVVPEYPSINE